VQLLAAYDARYRRLRKEAIDAHLARFGAVCPGYGVLPHTATKAELTVDHVIPVADGGPSELWNFQVLCGTCNRRKGRATDVAVDRPVSSGPAPKSARGPLIA